MTVAQRHRASAEMRDPFIYYIVLGSPEVFILVQQVMATCRYSLQNVEQALVSC